MTAGQENIPRNTRVLFVGYHSSHNHDLLPTLMSVYEATGRVPRPLVHKLLIIFGGLLLHECGCISGTRKNGLKVFGEGDSCIVIPGGNEEAMQGFENAYKLNWYSLTIHYKFVNSLMHTFTSMSIGRLIRVVNVLALQF